MRGPLATLLAWLAVNVGLALFNLGARLPLDGGRVLRSIFWAATGDFVRATRWAALGGQIFAACYGVRSHQVLAARSGQGVWLMLIGWFLGGGGARFARPGDGEQALADVPVTQVMRHQLRARCRRASASPSWWRDFVMQTEQRALAGGERGRAARPHHVRRRAAGAAAPVGADAGRRRDDSERAGRRGARRRVGRARARADGSTKSISCRWCGRRCWSAWCAVPTC